MIWWSQAHSRLGGAVCSVLRSLFAHAALVLRQCQRVHSSLHDKDAKVSLTFGSRAQKRHLQFITQGRALVSPVTTLLPCNQSIDQWIDEHDNRQSSLPTRPSFDKLRRYSDLRGGGKRMDCRNQLGDNKQKSLSDAQVCVEEALVASQQSSNESFRSFHTFSQFKLQKNQSCLTKKQLHNCTEREYHAQYTAKVPTRHRLCYSLLLLADCQSKMPLPSCSYRRLAAPCDHVPPHLNMKAAIIRGKTLSLDWRTSHGLLVVAGNSLFNVFSNYK